MAVIQYIRDRFGGDDTESAKISQIVRAGRRIRNKSEVRTMLDRAEKYYPSADYEAHIKQLRDYYNGNQETYLKALITDRFEIAGAEMDPVTMNIVRASAGLEAQAYRREPDRWIELDGKRVGEQYTEDDDEEPKIRHEQHAKRAERFAEAIKRARLSVVMPEGERRVVCAHTMIGRVQWAGEARKKRGLMPRPEVALFWSCDFRYIPHPEYPALVEAASFLAFRSSGKRWQFWTHDEETEQWTMQLVDEETGAVDEPEIWQGKRLPVFVMHSQLSQSSVYLDLDRDIVGFQDVVNMELTDHAFRSRLSGHKQLYEIGTNGSPATRKGTGFGTLWSYEDPRVKVGAIDVSMDLKGIEGVEKLLRIRGVANQQPPDAWATEPGPPLSGISRIVANIPSDQKRKERIELYTEVEEDSLLPILVDVCDTYGAGDLGGKIGREGFRYRVRFPKPEVYEEPEAKRLTAALAQKDGWISPAAAAVRAGFYPSVDEASDAGLSTELQAPVAPAGGSAKAVGAVTANEQSPRAPFDAERETEAETDEPV